MRLSIIKTNENTSISTENPLTFLDSVLNVTLFSLDRHSATVRYGIVTDEVLRVFTIINYVVLCMSVSLCGIVANAINIIVFLRQGFRETVNISFFGMAISDLILQTMTLWVSICFNPWIESIDVSTGEAISYMGAWVQVITTRITGWITAFVAFERCLCIVMPLKVKAIISPGRTKGVIVSIFVGATFCVAPVYFTFKVERVVQPLVNRTVYALVNLKNRGDIQNAMFYINNVVSPLASFTAVAICTILLSICINRASLLRWEKFGASAKDDNIKTRDQKLIKMVVSIAAIYIICYTPTISIFVWTVEDANFSFEGRYRNLFLLLSSFAFLFESVNSSLNVFIYYVMSTKYRDTFRSIFCKSES